MSQSYPLPGPLGPAVKARGVPPDRPLAALPTIKSSAVALQVIFLSSVTRGFLDRPSSPIILARPQLPHSSPLPWCSNHFAPFNSMSDFGPPSRIRRAASVSLSRTLPKASETLSIEPTRSRRAVIICMAVLHARSGSITCETTWSRPSFDSSSSHSSCKPCNMPLNAFSLPKRGKDQPYYFSHAFDTRRIGRQSRREASRRQYMLT
jgi:hypothetical protein